MISFEEALKIILTDVRKTGTERVGFDQALFRVLAEDVHSDIDMPPFDKAAMDGFACRSQDLALELEVKEVIAAGELARTVVGPGQCVKIMTGAMVPEGADTVVMVEQAVETRPGYIRCTTLKSPSNIAVRAEDVKRDDRIWEKGMLILPQHIAMFASVGCVAPLVAKKPRVAILSTGNELVEPHILPPLGMIRNSNGSQLVAQALATHCLPVYGGIVPDSEEATRKAIGQALSENDVVVLSGGVSMGDFDYVPAILRELGVEIRFQKVAIKPGRPTVFGTAGRSYVFGLPGNPVSSFINFEVMVKPLLYKMMGHNFKPLEVDLPLGIDFIRRKADRPEWVPVNLNDEGKVITVSYHGSAHIHAICMASGLMFVPKGVLHLEPGITIRYRPLTF